MSYILAALNKAEKDRQVACLAGVAALQPRVGTPKRPWWPVLLISMLGSALVLAIYLAWQLMFPGSAGQAALMRPSADFHVPLAETAPPVNPAMEQGGGQGAAAAPAHPADANAESASIASPSSLISDVPNNMPTLRAMAASARPDAPVSDDPAALAERHAQGPWQGGMHQYEYAGERDGSGLPVGAARAAGEFYAGSQGVDELTSDQLAEIPVLHSLPDHQRAQLPHLELNVHVYSDSPARRFVYINAERYGEGAQLEGGVMLEKIIPNGVILRQGGIVFRLLLKT